MCSPPTQRSQPILDTLNPGRVSTDDGKTDNEELKFIILKMRQGIYTNKAYNFRLGPDIGELRTQRLHGTREIICLQGRRGVETELSWQKQAPHLLATYETLFHQIHR